MAHAFRLDAQRRYSHVHFITALLLAAVVLVVTLTVRAHKPTAQPRFERGPVTAPAPR